VNPAQVDVASRRVLALDAPQAVAVIDYEIVCSRLSEWDGHIESGSGEGCYSLGGSNVTLSLSRTH